MERIQGLVYIKFLYIPKKVECYKWYLHNKFLFLDHNSKIIGVAFPWFHFTSFVVKITEKS